VSGLLHVVIGIGIQVFRTGVTGDLHVRSRSSRSDELTLRARRR